MSRCGELNEGQSLLGRTKQRRSLLPPLSGSPPSPPGAPFDLANVSCLDAFFCSPQLPSSQFQRLQSMADPQVTTQAFDLIQRGTSGMARQTSLVSRKMCRNYFVPARVRQRQEALGKCQSWGQLTDQLAPTLKLRIRGI